MANKYIEKLSPMRVHASLQYEPQRTNHFQIEIYDLPGGSRSTTQLSLAVNAASMPTIGNGVIDVAYGNAKVHFPGQAEYSGVDRITVHDYITTDIEKIIVDWQKLVYDPTTDRMGWAAQYKKSGKIFEFAPDGTNVRTWEVVGIWPSSVSYGSSLSMDGSSVKDVEITLSYDRAYRLN